MKRFIQKVLKSTKIGRIIYEPIHWTYRLYAVPHRRRLLRKYGPVALAGLAEIFKRRGIPAYALYGTLLGFTRDAGFIKHDDDMDFGVPIEYYKELTEILQKDLREPYRCCTYKDNAATVLVFTKIEDHSTLMLKDTLRIPIEQQMGVNIDIFPLNRCRNGDKEPEKLKRMTKLLGGAFTNSNQNHGIVRRFVKALLRLLLGGKPIFLQSRIEELMYKVNQGDRIGFILGAGTRNTVPVEWYGKGKRYQFEDTTFVGPENAHDYLTHIFGDYMQMPPESERPSHADNVYER